MLQQTFIDVPRKGVMVKMGPADPVLLACAVGEVYFELTQAGYKAGAEKWSRCKPHRSVIMDRVFSNWSQRTGQDSVFPWSEDFVIDAYVAFRKQDAPIKEQWQELLNYVGE